MSADAPRASGEEPVADIARQVARELREMRAVVYRIECVVGGLLSASSGSAHRDLQLLDALGQSLDGLAQFLDSAVTGMPPEWRFDPAPAAAALTLHDLRARLSEPRDAEQGSPAIRHGDCAFF